MGKRADKSENGCIGVHRWIFNVSDVPVLAAFISLDQGINDIFPWNIV